MAAVYYEYGGGVYFIELLGCFNAKSREDMGHILAELTDKELGENRTLKLLTPVVDSDVYTTEARLENDYMTNDVADTKTSGFWAIFVYDPALAAEMEMQVSDLEEE